MLKINKTMIVVGITPLTMHSSCLIFGQKQVVGSLIGGIPETQEMLDFCAQHNITSDIELIDIRDINQAYERINNGEVMYRVVIDMNSLR